MKRILAVDDEVELLEILSEHFAGRYEVDMATSGAVALQRFIQNRPDAVLLDVSMPGTSGVEALKLFVKADPAVPVVMVTASQSIAVAEDCLKSGALAWLPKPFNFVYLDHMAAIATEQVRARR